MNEFLKNICFKILIVLFFSSIDVDAQMTINMRKEGGVYSIPCNINGLELRFIFDTGASDVSISMTEALFMLKNDYLDPKDIIGKQYFSDATGDISEGTKIILRKIEFNGIILTNIEASVVHEPAAPLLLGLSALSKLGTFQFDPNAGTVTILNAPNNSQTSHTSQISQTSQTSNKSPLPLNDYNKEFPCLKKSGETIYSTKIDLGTFLIDDPSDKGRRIKKLVSGQTIEIINDKKYGNYALASINGCYGYVLKIGLVKYH
jgi:clan AA aspartic protease (TIGR02281 family)